MNQFNNSYVPPPPPPPPPSFSQGHHSSSFSRHNSHNQYQNGKAQHTQTHRHSHSRGRGRSHQTEKQPARGEKQLVKPLMFLNPWAQLENTPLCNHIHRLSSNPPVNEATLDTQTTFTLPARGTSADRVREDEWWHAVPKRWNEEPVNTFHSYDMEDDSEQANSERDEREVCPPSEPAPEPTKTIARSHTNEARSETLYDLFADE